jgi:hypothetical protein
MKDVFNLKVITVYTEARKAHQESRRNLLYGAFAKLSKKYKCRLSPLFFVPFKVAKR